MFSGDWGDLGSGVSVGQAGLSTPVVLFLNGQISARCQGPDYYGRSYHRPGQVVRSYVDAGIFLF